MRFTRRMAVCVVRAKPHSFELNGEKDKSKIEIIRCKYFRNLLKKKKILRTLDRWMLKIR